MRILVGCDHAGFHLKEDLKEYLLSLGHEVEDYGVHSNDSSDYPDVAFRVAEDVVSGKGDRGILICGTGVGMSIAANKVRGIRAALCHDVFSARASREHNNANILTMGERVIGRGLAREIVRVWLESEFMGDRHARRIAKIAAYEERKSSP
ncbi:MAG: ribose 5-phosphate isomerase B [Candidatus Caldatribacteriaceae bacterium]